ncbi:MAG: glycosyltransferase family 2 protein [Bdellovibrionota bacterium]
MLDGKKIVVVLPAYNAEKTLEKTFADLPHQIIDGLILTDDRSTDQTAALSTRLGIKTLQHSRNHGYGGNQKTCYRAALDLGADVIVMVHPDYQYNPKLVTALASLISCGVYDIALGSRILGNSAIAGGMPLYKWVSNRFLTLVQNLALGSKLSEYHTGFRAFSRKVLLTLPLVENSDDFIFDNEMLTQAAYLGFSIGEISCPTKYETDSSSISFVRSSKYGLGCLANSVYFMLARTGLYTAPFLSRGGRTLLAESATQALPHAIALPGRPPGDAR